MRFSWHRPAEDKIDHELLWLSVSLGGLVCAAAWFALHLPWPRCVFHMLTGHPCATCGATRSAIQFFHGNFLASWGWNPLAFVCFCAIALFDVYAFAVVVARAPRLRIAKVSLGEKNFARTSIVALLMLNWVYLLYTKPPL
jgi:hypothetical protein